MFLRRPFFIVMILAALFVAACGSTTSTTTGGGSVTATTAPTITPTATSGATSSSAMVKTVTATVKGKSETILTDAEGKTLYYFTSDTATKAACTGTCVGVWPPLLSTGSGSPASSATLPGKLTVQTDANGNQVEYNGHLLYTYSGDTAAGQTNGEGLFGKWFVCTPALKSQSSSAPGGYGY